MYSPAYQKEFTTILTTTGPFMCMLSVWDQSCHLLLQCIEHEYKASNVSLIFAKQLHNLLDKINYIKISFAILLSRTNIKATKKTLACLCSGVSFDIFKLITRPKQSQRLLYKHGCNSLIKWLLNPFPPTALRRCQAHMVRDGASSHKIDYFALVYSIPNLKLCQNCSIG